MKATYPGERIHIDVSGPFPNTLGGHKYCVMFKDPYSGMAWNVFIPSKTKVYEVTNEIKEKVMFYRCDNAAEYGILERLCN
jgi:hypothetical protein